VEYLSFVPNQPTSMYGEWDADKLKTEEGLLEAMPPHGQALDQLSVAYQLGGYRYDRLGEYKGMRLTSPLSSVVSSFKAELATITSTINSRNKLRPVAYEYLLPHNITNSTSV
jgi:hypothetical protein